MNQEKFNIDGFNIRFGDADFWFYWIRFLSKSKQLRNVEENVTGFFHVHTAFEIHVITENAASFLIEKKRVDAERGNCVIIAPNTAHYSYLNGNQGENVVFQLVLKQCEGKSGFFKQFNRLLNQHTYNAFPVTENTLRQILVFQQQMATFAQKDNKNVFSWEECGLHNAAGNILLELLHQLACIQPSEEAEDAAAQRKREAAFPTSPGQEEKKILLHEMVNNMQFPLEKIAEALGYSTRHVSRLIRRDYGKSLGDIRLCFRVDSAKRLLADHPELPLPKIAAFAGFTDENAMRRAFQKTEGYTPAQYRARKE